MPRIVLPGKVVKLLQIATQHEKHPSCPESIAAVCVGVVGLKALFLEEYAERVVSVENIRLLCDYPGVIV